MVPDDTTSTGQAAARLRARGLRVTPQRRAILAAFTGAQAEHLSADEVHARASAAVPEVGRGTVYAALAELTEMGLLTAVGSPEPVRYETNVEPHQHFRCRICLRLYDVELDAPPTAELERRGSVVEHTWVTAEGICADCGAFDHGLSDGAARSTTPGPGHHVELPRGTAYGVAETPVGRVQLLCTERGALRVMYADHAEGPAVAAAGARRRGARDAQYRLAELDRAVAAYFEAGTPFAQELAVDWEAAATAGDGATLDAIRAIPFGEDRSYELLLADGEGEAAYDRGLAIGSNPLALVVPCHRVSRGRQVPDWYVGGLARKQALRAHERQFADR